MFTRKQPEPAAAEAHSPRQIDPVAVEQAMAAIASFATQMSEITALFARGQQDMARRFDETTQRLDRAVVAVAAGEARIAAQVSAFERAAGEARRVATDHERASRDLVEQFRRTASELASDSIRPLKAEVESVSRHLADATSRVASASAGFSQAVDNAIGVVSAKAERMIERQADAFAADVSGTLESGRLALATAAVSLDDAAGALTRRIIATAEAQDAKLKAFETLTQEFGALKAALPSPEATAANTQRIEDATAFMQQASAGVSRAVGEMLIARESEADAARSQAAALADIAAGRTELATRLDDIRAAIDTTADLASQQRMEADAGFMARLDRQSEILEGISTNAEAELEARREIKAKIDAVATRQLELSQSFGGIAQTMDATIRRDSDERTRQLDAIGDRMDRLASGVDEIAAGKGAAHAQTLEVIAGLEAEREAMKRLTISVRMLAKESTTENQRIADRTGDLIRRLEAVGDRLSEGADTLAAKAEAMPQAAAPADAAAGESAAGLPLIAGEQLSFQRVLAGFRLLMRDIGGEAARMKEIVDGVAAGTDAWKAGPP
ncbi:MAG: hypothetical protein ACRCTI_10935, partial [Beijerinckiaceae bacterium]